METSHSGVDLKPEQLLGTKRKVTRADLADLIKLAKEHQAKIVRTAAFGGGDEPDEWCGTMWHPGPHVGPLVDALLLRNWVINHILIYGTPSVDGILVNIANQIRGAAL